MTHPNHLIANILADIQASELWWLEIAKKHGVTHAVVQVGWATQPYGVMVCGECSGSGRKGEELCKRCCGEGLT